MTVHMCAINRRLLIIGKRLNVSFRSTGTFEGNLCWEWARWIVPAEIKVGWYTNRCLFGGQMDNYWGNVPLVVMIVLEDNEDVDYWLTAKIERRETEERYNRIVAFLLGFRGSQSRSSTIAHTGVCLPVSLSQSRWSFSINSHRCPLSKTKYRLKVSHQNSMSI